MAIIANTTTIANTSAASVDREYALELQAQGCNLFFTRTLLRCSTTLNDISPNLESETTFSYDTIEGQPIANGDRRSGHVTGL